MLLKFSLKNTCMNYGCPYRLSIVTLPENSARFKQATVVLISGAKKKKLRKY
jgi:hypothetical protein